MIKMIDISKKTKSHRIAIAKCEVHLSSKTINRIIKGTLPKGDIIPAAKLAGILAAKKTHDLIPLCHPLNITSVNIDVQILKPKKYLEIIAKVKIQSKTGVEMEALTACSVSALTIYDMCKSVQKDIKISNLRLIRKSGGKRGLYQAE